jgi:hypothetical protein
MRQTDLADLTVVQKTIIDPLHIEGKPQKVIAKEVGGSHSAASKYINRKLGGRGKYGRKRFTSSRDGCRLERIVGKRPIPKWGSGGCLPRSGLRLELLHQEPLQLLDVGLIMTRMHILHLIRIPRSQGLEEKWRGTQSKML